MKTISKLSKHDIVRGLPKLSYDKDNICEACIKGKHIKSSFHPINIISTNKPLELLHIDLFGPIQTASLSGKRYGSVRSDHGGEFENSSFKSFFEENGISHNFSCPRTPQQNGVVERNNRTLQEMAGTMLNESNVEKYFWHLAIS